MQEKFPNVKLLDVMKVEPDLKTGPTVDFEESNWRPAESEQAKNRADRGKASTMSTNELTIEPTTADAEKNAADTYIPARIRKEAKAMAARVIKRRKSINAKQKEKALKKENNRKKNKQARKDRKKGRR